MREETDAWVRKAEGDYEGAVTLYRKRAQSFYHLICFACQQSAEKYLKAFLVENQLTFPKLHDLEKALLPLCRNLDQEFGALRKYLQVLDPYAVQFRYPGEKIEGSEVRNAMNAVKVVRRFVRGKFGLENQKRLL